LPVTLVLVLLVTGCSVSSRPSAAQEGELAPDFQLQNLDGKTVALKDFRGKTVLLNFWASWCSPCRAEMPYLQQIYEEWSDREFVLLTVNIGESPARVKEFLETNNLSLPVFLDAKKNVAQKYNVTAIPTSFFVDKNGIIQAKIIGAFPSKETIERYLSKIIP